MPIPLCPPLFKWVPEPGAPYPGMGECVPDVPLILGVAGTLVGIGIIAYFVLRKR